MAKRFGHEASLEHLAHHLHAIGEDMRDITAIFKEPIFLKPGNKEYAKMCDLMWLYEDGLYGLAELKASHGKRNEAIRQICSGVQLVEEMGHEVKVAKFVVYKPRFRFENETVRCY